MSRLSLSYPAGATLEVIEGPYVREHTEDGPVCRCYYFVGATDLASKARYT